MKKIRTKYDMFVKKTKENKIDNIYNIYIALYLY